MAPAANGRPHACEIGRSHRDRWSHDAWTNVFSRFRARIALLQFSFRRAMNRRRKALNWMSAAAHRPIVQGGVVRIAHG